MAAMLSEEFSPLDKFNQTLRFWWVIVLFMLGGGVSGFVIARFKPPLYEAHAVFAASIDFNKIDFMHPPDGSPPPYKLTQYDEDISLVWVEVSLREVIPQVAVFAQQNGWGLGEAAILGQASIERKHAYWELHFRSADPMVAQKIANYWAQQAYADLQAKQKIGALPAYLIFDLVQLAQLPSQPMYFRTNALVLASGLIGLLMGALGVNLPFRRRKSER